MYQHLAILEALRKVYFLTEGGDKTGIGYQRPSMEIVRLSEHLTTQVISWVLLAVLCPGGPTDCQISWGLRLFTVAGVQAVKQKFQLRHMRPNGCSSREC